MLLNQISKYVKLQSRNENYHETQALKLRKIENKFDKKILN